jgi:hypothetical protein
LNEHLIQELNEKQEMFRLGQKRQEKAGEPVKSIH